MCVEVSFGTRMKERYSIYIKKRLQHRCFPVNIAKFLATTVLKNIYIWLLLKIITTINMGGQRQRPKIGSN